ncbi:MAG: efflux RND transporter periplasmic adaptor subunit [Planctomycetota bacterium]
MSRLQLRCSFALIAFATTWIGAGESVANDPGNVSQSSRFTGYTEPIRRIQVAASESGKIDAIEIKLGDRVSSGDLLVRLDSNILDATRRVALAKYESSAQLEAAKAKSDQKKQRFEKLQGLLESGAGSVEEVRRAETDAEVAAFEVEALREERRLRQLEVAEIEARIAKRRVCSPITGVVTDVTKEVGEYVALGDPHLVTVVRLDQLRVKFFLPTDLARSLGQNMPVDLSFPETKRRCRGVIEYVEAVTQADSGRVRVHVLLDNSEQAFRSGVPCQLELQSEPPFPTDATGLRGASGS